MPTLPAKHRPKRFKRRHFEPEIILPCVHWYLRHALSYRDLEEMMVERGLSVDHTTILRWVQHFPPILEKKRRAQLRATNDSWRVDETYIKVKGAWMYLYRAVDSDENKVEFMLSPTRDGQAAGYLRGLGAFLCNQCRSQPLLSQSRQEAQEGHIICGLPAVAGQIFE